MNRFVNRLRFVKPAIATLVMLFAIGVGTAWARLDSQTLDIDITGDRGKPFRQYPIRHDSGQDIYRAYLEAERGQSYAIRVRNRSDERIGVVIAVDGRNIISGEKSYLRANERMYILGPYQQAIYQGWRTGTNRVNSFYFTDMEDSYADAWGDRSAMGVIAMAAFQEVKRYLPPRVQPYSDQPKQGRERQLDRAPQAAAPESRSTQPGTGFGDEQWSPSRRVEFEAQRRPFAEYFVKYEWRDTLCRKGVIKCGHRQSPPRNRFWDDERYDSSGFAPSPPDRRYYTPPYVRRD